MRAVERWSRNATLAELRSGIEAHQRALKRVMYKGARVAMRSELKVMRQVLVERSNRRQGVMGWKVQSKHRPMYAVGARCKWIDGLTFRTKKEAEKNASLGRKKSGKTYEFRVVKV